MLDESTVDTAASGTPAARSTARTTARTTVAPSPDRVLHSDPHDFAGLYIRHRASFTLHARRYLRDGRDADEVVQEAFLRLFLALPELETELQALAYCRRTITNLCIDRYRAQARRPSLVDLDSCGAAELADEEIIDPVVRAEDAATVRAALSLLSPLHRAALVKREIEEKPFPVIAEELDIAEDSVKHVLFRARRALRRILASTSLAPGSDAEISGALSRVARASGGSIAAFAVLFFLSLGTGPDLRSIPVVGADLPDLIPVTEMATGVANAVGTAVGAAADAVTSVGDGSEPTGTSSEPADTSDPAPAVAPSPSTSPTAVLLVVESPVATIAPSASPTPSVEPIATPAPAQSPTTAAEPTAVPEPTVEPSPTGPVSPEPSASASPEPAATKTAEPYSSEQPSAGGTAEPEPEASQTPATRPPLAPGERTGLAPRTTTTS